MITYFERTLRLTDLEVWEVKLGEAAYEMVIVDERRPPQISDLDLPDSVEEADLRENLITVSVFSRDPVFEAHIEELDQFAKQLTDHVALAHCDVVVKFYNGESNNTCNKVLKENLKKTIKNTSLTQLWHFNQN